MVCDTPSSGPPPAAWQAHAGEILARAQDGLGGEDSTPYRAALAAAASSPIRGRRGDSAPCRTPRGPDHGSGRLMASLMAPDPRYVTPVDSAGCWWKASALWAV
jgi:hypothetical protein